MKIFKGSFNFFFFFLLAGMLSCIAALSQEDLSQKIIPGRFNSAKQQDKPYVILISIDGFRHDYAEKFGAENIINIAKNGVKAESLIPAFPTKTFPNHYSIVTGLYPAHHGLINNRFFDPHFKEYYSFRDRKTVEDKKWYGGLPFWVLAEQQQMITASFFWVGSEAAVEDIFPTFYYLYTEKIPVKKRIQTVVDWLRLPEDRRPHFITFYLPEVDHAGHKYGPDAPETEKAVKLADASIKELVEAVNSTGLPVNFILVSDHGMTKINTEASISLPSSIDRDKFIVTGGDAIVELYAKNKEDIIPYYEKIKKDENGYSAYLKEEMPEHLNYGSGDDKFNRLGDIILLSHFPRIFSLSGNKPSPGFHGYDPFQVKDMHGIFYAWGPQIKRNVKIPSFELIHVYPLMAHLLGLTYSHKIDGDNRLVKQVLKYDK